jgi:dihydrofolate reductase
MEISIIVSVSENWMIGKNNKLLWKLSDDLKRFKKITDSKPVIMGQKTFESLPKGALPNRTNIVLSDDPTFTAPNIITAESAVEALLKARQTKTDETFIIGGGMIYRLFLDYVDKVYLTVVHTTIDGDTSFPKLDLRSWKLIEEEFRNKDEKNEYDVTYKIYKRRNNERKS